MAQPLAISVLVGIPTFSRQSRLAAPNENRYVPTHVTGLRRSLDEGFDWLAIPTHQNSGLPYAQRFCGIWPSTFYHHIVTP